MAEPKISVMLLTYNRARLVSRAINSVLNQTFGDFELLLVNNAAEDDTEKVIQPFLSDKRIVYKKLEKNIGPLGGLNEALSMVTGRYMMNISDDDEFLPDALKIVSEKFDEMSPKGIDILWFDCVDAEAKKYSGWGIRKEGPIYYEDLLCNKLKGDYQAVMSRKAFGNHKFDENAWGGSTTIFNLRCHKNSKIYYFPIVIEKLYREHGESRITVPETSLLNHIPEIVYTSKKFLEEFGQEIKRLCPVCYGPRLATLGFYQILNGEKEGKKNLMESFRYRFSVFHFIVWLCSFVLSREQIKLICRKFFFVRRIVSDILRKFSKPVNV